MIKHGYNDNKAMFAIDNDVGGKIMITKKNASFSVFELFMIMKVMKVMKAVSI